MKEIEKSIEKIDKLSINDLDTRIELIKKLNIDISKEKNKYQELLDNLSNNNIYINKNTNLKNVELNKLINDFDNSNLENKINIYKEVSFKIDEIMKVLFHNNLDNCESNINSSSDLESDSDDNSD